MSDGIGMQSGECLLNSFILLTKDLTCSDGIDEQLADDGKVGSAGAVISSPGCFGLLMSQLRQNCAAPFISG